MRGAVVGDVLLRAWRDGLLISTLNRPEMRSSVDRSFTNDHAEAARIFVEKRASIFRGR